VLILDDILTAPFKGVLWIVQELVAAAQEEQAAESDRIKDRLRELYMLLETGQMTEAEFDAEESTLLDRLDAIELAATPAEDDDRDAGGEDDEADEDGEDDDQDLDDGEDDGEDEDDAAVAAVDTDPAGGPSQRAATRESDDDAD